MRWSMEILYMLLLSVSNIVFLILGAKLGRKEEVKLPELNPVKVIQEHKSHKETQRELDKIETILQNIENYDGTPNNQQDVPGR
jgi:hypothetical protein